MEKRFAIFLALSLSVLAANAVWVAMHAPPPAKVANQAGKDGKPAPAKPKQPVEKNPEVAKPAPKDDGPDKVVAKAEAPVEAAPQWVTLGSADPESPYRMLVTLTNRGAAVERIELSSPRFRDLEDRSGYLGHLAPTDAKGKAGAVLHVVGAGTPAALAGLKVDDVITSIVGQKVVSAADLVTELRKTRPGEQVEVVVLRDGKNLTLKATLGRRPLEVVKPELDTRPLEIVKPGQHDPFSLLVTMQQIGDDKLEGDAEELKGANLRNGNWEVVEAGTDRASFLKKLPDLGLEILKHYQLAKADSNASDPSAPLYHLMFEIEIRNTAEEARDIAYRLDGPTGLPLEGVWYASPIGRVSGAGLRDLLMRFEGQDPTQVTCSSIAAGDAKPTAEDPKTNTTLQYIAVDCQYFGAALIPQRSQPEDTWFAEVVPLRVGAVPKEKVDHRLTNVSFRLVSVPTRLAAGETLKQRYQFFAGPKRPPLLANYKAGSATLGDLVYFGWPIFKAVAVPMLHILHAFYSLVGNYGIAIVMLTVLVRGCMFPLSRKQALSAQKMQELQPEMKRIAEKYKKQPDQRTKAQQELFRKHNYNPLGGCLLMFIQLPIFIGLYRSLSVDVELRQAPLISEAIRWCSNLAAPDMFFNWSGFMPEFVSRGTGFFGLGPYLNLLPLVTIGLFIWQQKMFMPPPADEQAALQQKMMQYMMIFMGIMFFKVPSGLCIYFIASSLWGIAERKVLPKTIAPGTALSPAPVPATVGSGANGKGDSQGKKRQRGRK